MFIPVKTDRAVPVRLTCTTGDEWRYGYGGDVRGISQAASGEYAHVIQSVWVLLPGVRPVAR